MNNQLTSTDLLELGIKPGPIMGIILKNATVTKDRITGKQLVSQVISDPNRYHVAGHELYHIADAILTEIEKGSTYIPVEKPWKVWGDVSTGDTGAISQMKFAMELPVVTQGALMPDFHLGYGVPIGSVLACDNAVIPNAVGVDIACRMKLSGLNAGAYQYFSDQKYRDALKTAIDTSSFFGMGVDAPKDEFSDHPVMDAPEWKEIKFLSDLKDRAATQLGTSGSGNHFVEFGTYKASVGPNVVVALLSHSGSRGTGAKIADHYKRIAISKLSEKHLRYKDLAWLSLDDEAGQEYWKAMNLMGRYASANHELIHKRVIAWLRKNFDSFITSTFQVENHHNFAWKETHNGKEVIVHRKGATPSSIGEWGVIPGSMGDSCFVVEGKGNETSLRSSSHGAGRRMSRTAARAAFNWEDTNAFLKSKNIELISAGLDEVPNAYKNIHEVMAYQTDLVTVRGEFLPQIVKMSAGGKAED